MVQAGGATFFANYQALTGRTTAYAELMQAVQDNPFSLLAA